MYVSECARIDMRSDTYLIRSFHYPLRILYTYSYIKQFPIGTHINNNQFIF